EQRDNRHSAIFESKNSFSDQHQLSPSNGRKISITLGHISRTGLAQEDSCPDQAPRFVSLSRSGANRSFSLLFCYLSVSWGRDGALWEPGYPIALQFVRIPGSRAALWEDIVVSTRILTSRCAILVEDLLRIILRSALAFQRNHWIGPLITPEFLFLNLNMFVCLIIIIYEYKGGIMHKLKMWR
uniref:Uncharacterized protein n=1 Tax=Strigamia maritima TaxID=126957 RepID=T1JM12_STRMM